MTPDKPSIAALAAMTPRTAALVFLCFGTAAVRVCPAQEAMRPPDSSFIIRLADEAIAADGTEAVLGREYSRSVFANAFLGGYCNPGSTVPVNAVLSSSRINGAGWNAGQRYKASSPNSVEQIMREYGYTEFEGTGTWSVGFERGGFWPDGEQVRGNSSPYWCWYLAHMHSAELDGQIAGLVSRDARLRGATLRVRVKGYVSKPGQFGHLGVCERQVYAVNVVADGG